MNIIVIVIVIGVARMELGVWSPVFLFVGKFSLKLSALSAKGEKVTQKYNSTFICFYVKNKFDFIITRYQSPLISCNYMIWPQYLVLFWLPPWSSE